MGGEIILDQLKQIANKRPILKKILYPALFTRRKLIQKIGAKQSEILANLREVLIGDPVVMVNEFEGIFAIDKHSDLFSRILLNKCYEPEIVDYCKRYIDPEKDVIDVGANIGFYSVMFAKNTTISKILAIEPTRHALTRLRRNIALNDVVERIEIYEGAISNSNGLVKIKTIKGKEEFSSLGEMSHPAIADHQWELEEVKATTLDDIVEKKSLRPGFLKVDVEGVEHLVFEGAQKVLSTHRPVILSELVDSMLKKNGSSAEEVRNIIKMHDYELFDPLDPSAQPGENQSKNIICVPKEMKLQSN